MRTIIILLFFFPVLSHAYTLTWDTYPTGHKIQAQCLVGEEAYTSAGEVTNVNTMLVERAVNPGQTLKCRIRAVRLTDNAASDYTSEAVYARPSLPLTPTGLKVTEAP